MLGNATGNTVQLRTTQAIGRGTNSSLLTRKIWLPKLAYLALPYFYLLAGISALLATIYINHWLWMLPHYMIFSAACLHLGVIIFRRRHRPDQSPG